MPAEKAKPPTEGYISSLKTLLNAGLLTREEYDEMIEKYKRR